jgi:hypothetical protein
MRLRSTQNLELEEVGHELGTKFHYKFICYLSGTTLDQKFLVKAPSKLGVKMLKVWSEVRA